MPVFIKYGDSSSPSAPQRDRLRGFFSVPTQMSSLRRRVGGRALAGDVEPGQIRMAI